MEKKPLAELLNKTTKTKSFETADEEAKKHKEALKIAEKVQGYKKAGRKLQAGEKRTEKVLVNFAPSEFALLRDIMLRDGKQYQAIAEFIRDSILNYSSRNEQNG
ncbi:MAG: hypothetical protein LBG21_06885 [Campylobacteraceae bacterium]|jgi:hypothetical protein|nr:hypothetical protein [Campylobacteraceae bacterium]